jgi:predicted amidophosphoribosyltransferase
MPPILKDHQRYWGAGWLAVFGDYKPWGVHKNGGGTRENYPPHSGRILDLKDGKADSVTYFKDLVEPVLGDDDFVIVIVPGHDPARPSKGLKALAAELAKGGNRADASGALVRTQKIAKLARGGDRSEAIHANSVVVADVSLIKGKHVLLLDDVTKTGNSLRACEKILLDAGATSVTCVTMGKT